MIVNLENGRIVGFGVDAWKIFRRMPDADLRAVGNANTFEKAFHFALCHGIVKPGTILDMMAFTAFLRDASKRFTSASMIRLAEDFTASRIDGGDAWQLTRDTHRGGKHAVKIATVSAAAGLPTLLNEACWNLSFRARQTMELAEVCPFMLGIAQRLLNGAGEVKEANSMAGEPAGKQER